MERIDLLIALCEKTGLYGSSDFKTGVLAKKLGVSQQTISNALKELDGRGLIKREPYRLGINVSIKDEGRLFLQSYKKKLDSIFHKPKKLFGEVFSGIGEGGFYVMQKGYKKQFKEKFGMTPFSGTLNLKVDPLLSQSFLSDKKMILIDGFKSNNRTFGGLKMYPVKINNAAGAVIIPDRTHYTGNTIEVISEHYLREKLKLKDGGKVTLSEA